MQSSFLRRKGREEECSDARAFFCCGSKALWPQRLWGAIRAKSPQMWLWAGDAVYLGGDQPSSLEEAFNAQLQQEVDNPIRPCKLRLASSPWCSSMNVGAARALYSTLCSTGL